MTTTTDPRHRIATIIAHRSPHHGPARMTGAGYRYTRKAILEAATGRHHNLSDCGINNMMRTLYALFPVPTYTCQADREAQLTAQIKTHA